MKIVSVDIMKLKTEGAGPVRPIICRVNTDQGIYGIGEAGHCEWEMQRIKRTL